MPRFLLRRTETAVAADAATAANSVDRLGRRRLLVLSAGALLLPAVATRAAFAQGAGAAGAVARIQQLDDVLLQVMKQGEQTPFSQRYAALEHVVDQTFDLNAILQASVGLGWSSLSPDQKTQLLAAFRRYTVSSYTANFNNYNGQRFQIEPETRALGNGEVVVSTTITDSDGSSNKLSYVMRQGAAGWQVVDVLADGTISRVAVQRSDFHSLLASGGVPALVQGLQSKVAALSGGLLA
jgi:phospholipid transport system substrate-binding protein